MRREPIFTVIDGGKKGVEVSGQPESSEDLNTYLDFIEETIVRYRRELSELEKTAETIREELVAHKEFETDYSFLEWARKYLTGVAE